MNRIVSIVAGFALLASTARAGDAEIPKLLQTIPMPDVKGRIDHLAVDVAGQRLFVAALGNSSVEVLDLKTGSDVHSIVGLAEPQGILFVTDDIGEPDTPATKERLDANGSESHPTIVVACGGDGTVKLFDATTFEMTRQIEFDADADNLRYESATKRVFVGFADGAIGIAESGKRIGEVKLEGHPESFQLESSGSRLFVNIPSAKHVAVVDREKRKVIATWPIQDAVSNYPMALDDASHRLFVGCRKPAALVVLDTVSGKAVAHFPIGGDVDDVFFDRARKRVYAACGEGTIDVFEASDSDHYKLVGRAKTAPGARTALFVVEMNRLFVAVPRRGDAAAEVRVYDVGAK
ncbi:MAG: hypothetical protein HYR85_20660 [Planctomycetes bacterium]|nr:hypothetical protein [Planctomycetota bacterium]